MSAPSLLDPEYAEEDDRQLEELTAKFQHRVRYFAYRIEKRFGLSSSWRDDLISAGYWGLLKALRNRRPEAHDHELSAYVSRRVEGAVIDEARTLLTRNSNHSQCDPVEIEAGGQAEKIEFDWSYDQRREDPELEADRQVRWQEIERLFADLDVDHRQLLMAYATGQSIAEIAREDGMSPARLQSRMTRVARQVRARAPELRRLLRHEI